MTFRVEGKTYVFLEKRTAGLILLEAPLNVDFFSDFPIFWMLNGDQLTMTAMATSSIALPYDEIPSLTQRQGTLPTVPADA